MTTVKSFANSLSRDINNVDKSKNIISRFGMVLKLFEIHHFVKYILINIFSTICKL
jgi:hypothetical protein